MGTNYSGTYATPRLDLGIAYQEFQPDPDQFIAEQVFVPFMTEKRDASFSVRKRESLLQDVDTRRASRGNFNRIDGDLKDLSYNCDTHGLEALVDDEERELYASDFDAEMAAVEDVDQALRISKEKRAAAALFNTTTFTGSSLYTDASSSNPITNPNSDMVDVILSAVEANRSANGGMLANALVLSYSNLLELLKNTGIRGHFPGAQQVTLMMLKDALPSIFGLERLIVGKAMRRTSADGASTPSFSNIWSNSYLSVCRVAPGESASLRTPCVGRTMKWSRFDASLAVQMYREEQSMSDVVRAFECVDELITDTYMGHLVKVR